MSESKQISPMTAFTRTLDTPTLQQEIQRALPPGVSLSRFTSTAKTAISNSPELLEADRQSLYNAIVRAAQDGLLPDGREGFINIYNTNIGTKENPKWIKKAQFLPMVYGIIQKLGKAGIDAYAKCVFKGEDVEIWSDDTGQHIKHKQNPFSDSREMIGVYAVGTSQNGRPYIEAMNMADIQAIREKSKSKDKGPWVDSFDRMAQKSALHRLAKRMPITDPDARAEVDRVLESAEDEFDYGNSKIDTMTTEPRKNVRPSALQHVVESTQESEQPPEFTEADVI